jgi:hypothetical protein
MMLSSQELLAALLGELTPEEREGSVAYLAETPMPGGTTVQVPGATIDIPFDAALAFIDRQPLANWGHACRYVLFDWETGSIRSMDAQFHPFRPGDATKWRVVFKAPSVPATAVFVPP